MGSDMAQVKLPQIQGVSIHTPAWGVTYNYEFNKINRKVSIHTPAWGVTDGKLKDFDIWMFQSTLPHGE